MMVFFFVFSVWTRRSRPIFPFSNLALRPGSSSDSSRLRSSISPPWNHVALSLAKQVRFEHSIRSPSPITTSKREEKHPDKRQTNDQTKSFSAVRRRSVLTAAVRPDRDRGQRCRAATSLATARLLAKIKKSKTNFVDLPFFFHSAKTVFVYRN